MKRVAVLDAYQGAVAALPAETHEAYHIFFEQVVSNVATYLNGGVPARALNPDALGRRPRPGA